jgi:3',5'-cyclic AMP phosphodiesterase CpdA
MLDARVVVVSDTHLSPRAPEAASNWEAVVDYVGRAQPELVLHAGDLTLDGASTTAELGQARARLDSLPAPWLAVPGNHDIGDNPGVSPAEAISEERLGRWLADVGPDHWQADIGPWTLLGINAQLFGSGLDAEAAQWEWLSAQLSDRERSRPTVLVCHKPIYAGPAELAGAPSYRFVPNAARRRLMDLFADGSVPLVVSGHVHQFRRLADGHRSHIWAPTTWALLPEHAQRTVGLKQCGVLSLSLGHGGEADVELISPPGMRDLTLLVDIPDPYEAA